MKNMIFFSKPHTSNTFSMPHRCRSRCHSASDALLESGSLSEPPRADEALADGIWSWGWHDDDDQEQPSAAVKSRAGKLKVNNVDGQHSWLQYYSCSACRT